MDLNTFLNPLNVRYDVRKNLEVCFFDYLTPDMSVYDIGCGNKPFAAYLKDKVKEYIGVDIEDGFYDSSHIDLIGSAYDIPVENNVADAVILSQVIEHLEDPLTALKEANRILKKDGLLFLSFPFLYPMHAGPHDYLRYTEFFMEKTLKRHGFEVIKKSSIGGFWYCAGLYTDLYLSNLDRGILKKTKLIRIVTWFIKSILSVLHSLEGVFFDIARQDKEKIRAMWTVNYVFVARKEKASLPVVQDNSVS